MNKKTLQIFFMLCLFFLAGCGRGGDTGSGSGSGCGQVSNVTFDVFPSAITVFFHSVSGANSFRVEYGPTGFMAGTGKTVVTSSAYVELKDLNPSTTYDIFITSICSSTQSSAPYKLNSVTTQPSQCNGTTTAEFYQLDATNMNIVFNYSGSSFLHHAVEYGPAGFVLGTGTKMNASNHASTLQISNLTTNQMYDFYVKTYCATNDSNTFKKYTYTATPTCPKPFNLHSYLISGSCNSGTATRGFSWSSYGSPVSYEVSLIQNANSQPGAVHHTTSNTSMAFGNMFCNWVGFYVRSKCADSSVSSWAGPYLF